MRFGRDGRGRIVFPPALLRYAPLLAGMAVVLAVVAGHVLQLSAHTFEGESAGLRATPTHGGIALSWEAPAGEDVAGYRILRRYASENTKLEVLVEDTGSSATFYVDDTVRPKTEYVYRVQPIGPSGLGERSNYVRLRTPALGEGTSSRVNEPVVPVPPITNASDATRNFSLLRMVGGETVTTTANGLAVSDAAFYAVVDFHDKILVFERSGTTVTYNESLDITLDALHSNSLSGAWTDGTTIWVLDNSNDKLFAYTISTKARDTTKDITLSDLSGYTGITSHGNTVWVTENADDKIYAYTSGARDATKDITPVSANEGINATATDGVTMWVYDEDDDKVYAYVIDPQAGETFGQRVADREPQLDSNNTRVNDMAYDDGFLYVFNRGGDEIGDPRSHVYAYAVPDMRLSGITVDGAGIPGFLPPDGDNSQHRISPGTAQVTVAAAAVVPGYSVSITSPADADSVAAGHQVDLGDGRNEVTIMVADPENTTTLDIGLDLNRGVTTPGGWAAHKDFYTLLATGNNPRGIWTNGTTMWVVNVSAHGLHAYSVSTGLRDADKDITLHGDNGAPRGIWSNGTTMWVVDSEDDKLFAYTLSNGMRDADKDFTLDTANTAAYGLWRNSTHWWVSDDANDRIYAYKLSDSTRDHNAQFSTHSDNHSPQGIWSNGTTMWVAQENIRRIFAYRLSDGVRDPGKEIDTLSAQQGHSVKPEGMTGFGATLWFADAVDILIRAFNLPEESDDATLGSLTVSPRNIIGFEADRTSYAVGVASAVTTATVAATVNDTVHASLEISPADADSVTTGHQVSLSAGANEVTVTVTAEDDSTQVYTISINRGVTDDYGWKAENDLDGLIAAENTAPFGVWSDGTTIWISDGDDGKLYAYTQSDGERDSSADFTLDDENANPRGIWSNGTTTMWVADDSDDKLYAYRLSDGARDSSADFDLDAQNANSQGIWSNGTTMWVADDSDDKLYAYRLSDGERDSDEDFDLDAQNANPQGIWSDGTTMWVADDSDDKLYAYRLSDGERDSARDFNTLAAAGNTDPGGLWSLSGTLWVVDIAAHKVFSYNIPPPAPSPPANLSATGVHGGATLSWDDPGDSTITVYQYRVQQSGETTWNPDWTDIPNSGATTTYYLVTGVTEHTTYTFEVRAKRGDENGGVSSVTEDAGGNIQIAVQNLGQSSDGTSNVGNTSGSNENAQGFALGSTARQYYLRGVTIDVSTAAGASTTAGAEIWSATATEDSEGYKSPNAMVVALTDVDVTSTGTTTLHPPSDTLLDASTVYFVVLKGTGGDSSKAYTIATTTATAEDATPVAGWSLYDKRHVKGTNWGTQTGVIRMSVEIDTVPPPAAPANFDAAPADTSAVLTWDNPNNATIMKYQYRVSDDDGTTWDPDWTDVSSSSATTTTHTVTGLTNGEEYTIELRAVNGTGDGTSSSDTVTPNPVPAAPASFTAKGGDAQVVLTWDDPSDSSITHYRFRHKLSATTNWNPDWTDIPSSGATTTTHTVTNLSNGNGYTFEVRAVNMVDEGPKSTAVATPRPLPAAPTSFAAAPGNTQAVLTWANPNNASITKYQYRVSDDGGNNWDPDWADIPSSGATTTTHTVPDLTNGEEYTIELRAVNSTGEGPVARDTATPNVVPAAPANLAAKGGDAQVVLSWDNPSDSSITHYEFRVSDDGGSNWDPGWDEIPSSGASTISYTVTGLSNGIEHTFEVRAENSGGTGPQSRVTATPRPLPATPTNFNAAPGNTQAVLTWNNPNNPSITKYRYRVSDDGGSNWSPDWTDIPSSSATTTTHTVTSLSNGTEHTFEVRAVNSSGESTAARDTATPNAVPNAPTSFDTSRDDGEVTLTWDDPSDSSITRYEFRVSDDGGSNWDPDWDGIPSSGASTTSYTVTGLENGIEHTFEVRAVNSAGDGLPSRGRATPLHIPAAPANFRATGGVAQVTLTWSNPDDDTLTHYQHRYRETSSSTWSPDWTDIASSHANTVSLTISNLSNGTDYTFEVRAVNDREEGPESTDTATPEAIPDTTRPVLQTAVVDATILILTYDEPLDTNSVPATSAYTVRSGNPSPTVTDVDVMGTTVTVTLSAPVRHGRTVRLTYSVPSSNPVQDPSENRAVAFSNRSVSNNTPAPTPPGAPTGLSASPQGQNRIDLSWNAPTDDGGADITGYKIEVSTDGNSWTDLAPNTRSTATTHSHTSLPLGSTRHYRVSAINSAGTSASSVVDSATTDSRPVVTLTHRELRDDYYEQVGSTGSTIRVSMYEILVTFSQPVESVSDDSIRQGLALTGANLSGWSAVPPATRPQIHDDPYITTWRARVRPLLPRNGGNATVRARLTANAARDAQNRLNRASPMLSFTVRNLPSGDTTRPQLVFRSSLGSSVAAGPFDIKAVFSEPVTGFTQSDVRVTGGRVTAFVPEEGAKEYNITVRPNEPSGRALDSSTPWNLEDTVQIQLRVAENAAQDTAGNRILGGDSPFYAARPRPTVSITPSAVVDIESAFMVTIRFSEVVTGFTQSEFQVRGAPLGGNFGVVESGAATVTAWDAKANGREYVATVTPTRVGAVILRVNAGAAQDSDNYRNLPATERYVWITGVP